MADTIRKRFFLFFFFNCVFDLVRNFCGTIIVLIICTTPRQACACTCGISEPTGYGANSTPMGSPVERKFYKFVAFVSVAAAAAARRVNLFFLRPSRVE